MNNSKRSDRINRFLQSFRIEWMDPFGYVFRFDGESGKPCSLKFIAEMEKLYYAHQNAVLRVRGDFYWGESATVKLMAQAAEIFYAEFPANHPQGVIK